MEYLYRQIAVILLIMAGVSSCCRPAVQPADGQDENCYELLLGRAYAIYDDEICPKGNVFFLNAIEPDAVRRLIYFDYYLCEHILKEGFQNSKDYLRENMLMPRSYYPHPHAWTALKKDFNRFSYMNLYFVDLTKNANTLFLHKDYGNIADYSFEDIKGKSIILVEPKCDSLYISDSICISHASRLMMKEYNDFTKSFIYDRNRQMIVAATFRENSYRIKYRFNISEITEISREDFYYLWNARRLSEEDTLVGPPEYHEVEEERYTDCLYPYYGRW